jgi:hypothetical protein
MPRRATGISRHTINAMNEYTGISDDEAASGLRFNELLFVKIFGFPV